MYNIHYTYIPWKIIILIKFTLFFVGREANEEYAKYLHKVEDKLLRLMSLGLGLEGHELKEAVGGDKLEYMLKINYYPPCPRPDLALGVPAHTDMSALTILVPNEVQGLQVFNDEHWYDVKYIPNALIIHVGDQSEVYIYTINKFNFFFLYILQQIVQ